MRSKTGYLNPGCKRAKSPIAGVGIFAKKFIKPGEIIAIWGGKVFEISELKKISKKNRHLVEISEIQITEHHCLINTKIEDCDRINHSCSPNTKIEGQIVLVAIKEIKPGEEITFDYETAEKTKLSGLPFKCSCSSKKCRKIIDGNAWKWAYKKNSDILSWHLKNS